MAVKIIILLNLFVIKECIASSESNKYVKSNSTVDTAQNVSTVNIQNSNYFTDAQGSTTITVINDFNNTEVEETTRSFDQFELDPSLKITELNNSEEATKENVERNNAASIENFRMVRHSDFNTTNEKNDTKIFQKFIKKSQDAYQELKDYRALNVSSQYEVLKSNIKSRISNVSSLRDLIHSKTNEKISFESRNTNKSKFSLPVEEKLVKLRNMTEKTRSFTDKIKQSISKIKETKNITGISNNANRLLELKINIGNGKNESKYVTYGDLPFIRQNFTEETKDNLRKSRELSLEGNLTDSYITTTENSIQSTSMPTASTTVSAKCNCNCKENDDVLKKTILSSCSCGKLKTDMDVSESNIFESRSASNVISYSTQSPLQSSTPILKHEVNLAHSLMDTFKSGSELLYKEAKERETARIEKLKILYNDTLSNDSKQAEKFVPSGKSSVGLKSSSSQNARLNNIEDSYFAGSEHVPLRYPVIVRSPKLKASTRISSSRLRTSSRLGLPPKKTKILSGRKIKIGALQNKGSKPDTFQSPSITKVSVLKGSKMLRKSKPIALKSVDENTDEIEEVPSVLSDRLTDILSDALGLDKKKPYKCRIIYHD